MINFDPTTEKKKRALARTTYKGIGHIIKLVSKNTATMIKPENTIHTIMLDDLEDELFSHGISFPNTCKKFILDTLCNYKQTSEPCVWFPSLSAYNGNPESVDFITVSMTPMHEYYIQIDFYDVYRWYIDMDRQLQYSVDELLKSTNEHQQAILYADFFNITTNDNLNEAAKKVYINYRIESLWMYLNDLGYNLILCVSKDMKDGININVTICRTKLSKFIYYLITRVFGIFKSIHVIGYNFKCLN